MILAALLLLLSVQTGASGKSKEEIGRHLDPLLQAPITEIEKLADTFFKNLSPEETMMARDILLSTKPSPDQETLLLTLIQHWSRLNGSDAYEFAQTQQAVSKSDAVANALLGWAASDAVKAWDQLMLVSNRGADRRFSLTETLDVIASSNLKLALQLYEDLLPDRACLKCCASRLMIAASRNGEFDKILGAVNLMPHGPTRDALRDEYWSYFGRYLPQWGLRDLKSLTDPEDAKAAEVNLCMGWAHHGFSDCMEYILKQAAPEMHDELILASVQIWARHAVNEDVVKLIKSLPADLSERSLLGLATSLSSVDPQATLDWIKTFPPSDMRTTAIGRAMTRWAKIDHDAARAYFHAEKETELRGILLWYYLLAKLANNTLRFADLIEIDSRYYLDWRVRLFSEIAVELADPSINNGGKYDLNLFVELVRARTDFSPEAKAKILLPLNRK